MTFACNGLESGIMLAVMSLTRGRLSYIQPIDLIDAVTKKSKLVALDMIEFVPQCGGIPVTVTDLAMLK